MSHLIYNVKTLVYVVPFSIIIVVSFSVIIYKVALFGENYGTIRGELWHYSGRKVA